jgi:hypothetical protein
MSFAGLGDPPKSPPGRAGLCAPVGGYMRKRKKSLCGGVVGPWLGTSPRQPSSAALVPFHTSPPSRGALRSAGVPTIAASTTPAPLQPRALHSPGPARHLGRLRQAQGNTPCAPRGGLCGLLAARQTFQKPPGVPTGWGSLQGQNLPVGPPLGALRCRFRGALAPRSRPPTALWGIQEGKADVTRCETGARRTSSAATRASCPPSSDLVNSSALKHGRLAFTGAR